MTCLITYEKATGLILQTESWRGEPPDDTYEIGYLFSDGEHIDERCYIRAGRLVRTACECPAPGWELDPETGQWVAGHGAISALRVERNRRLAESDWVLLDDVPLSDEKREAWKTYRQALRDMPETVNWANVKWPVPPS